MTGTLFTAQTLVKPACMLELNACAGIAQAFLASGARAGT